MHEVLEKTQQLLELLGASEGPYGVCYSDTKPEGFGPKKGEIISREKEIAGTMDWEKVFSTFSCLVGNIWKARKKRTAGWISHEECGCMGGGYYSGVYRPYVEMNVFYVSTGIPGTPMEGEHYLPSPESMRAFMDDCAPPEPTGKYCVVKPLEHFLDAEKPLVVDFFVRPEELTGLFNLVSYATGSHNSVVSPFGAGCTNLIAWPLVYQKRGIECAVLGGFDISARKFLKPDELTLAIPFSLYCKMLAVMDSSALPRKTWQQSTRKKVLKSQEVWGKSRQSFS